ncbi:unnamed protein product [Trichobilharzia szidati]|nr:unnamed protein product [Trichobilharzia szidati]
MSSRFVVNYYRILYSVILLLVHFNLSTGEYGKNNYEQIETGYTSSVEKEIVKAPLSFMPVCKPQQIHTFSQRQIRCACGVQCRYVCQTKATTSTEKKTGEEQQGKTCKRVCRQKPCYRPLSHTVYHYRLVNGLCRI